MNHKLNFEQVNNIPFGLNCVDNLEMKTHDSEVSDVMLKVMDVEVFSWNMCW